MPRSPPGRSAAGHYVLWSAVPSSLLAPRGLRAFRRQEWPVVQAQPSLDRLLKALTAPKLTHTVTGGFHSPGCVEALCILGYLLNKTPKLVSRHHLLRGQSCPAAPGGLGTTVGGQQWQHEDKGGCDIWASSHLLQPSQPPQGLGAALVPMSHSTEDVTHTGSTASH